MKSIESASNPRIKAVRSLLQKGDFSEAWMIEGKTLVAEALSSGVAVTEVFVTDESLVPDNVSSQTALYRIPPRLMTSISTVETPPGILAIARRPEAAMHSQIRRFAALLNAVRDPGNLGAIIRTAEASGCEWIACSRDCADPFQPKSVRASMGSIFRVPAFKVHDLDGFVADQRGRNVNVVALHPRNGADLPSIHPVAPSLIVIGGETAGIPGTIEVDTWIRIPMKGKVESLNTAVAASLCFYHFASGRA